MRSVFNYMPVLHHRNFVRRADRRKTVSDHDRRPVAHQLIERLADRRLACRVGMRLIGDRRSP